RSMFGSFGVLVIGAGQAAVAGVAADAEGPAAGGDQAVMIAGECVEAGLFAVRVLGGGGPANDLAVGTEAGEDGGRTGGQSEVGGVPGRGFGEQFPTARHPRQRRIVEPIAVRGVDADALDGPVRRRSEDRRLTEVRLL